MSAPLALEVTRVTKMFGSVAALDAVSVTAAQGEFLTILGQSGSGKTTLLRVIAGLDQPTAVERLHIAGQDVIGVPAHLRNVSTVFQHYGLFPHMSVGENVEYGLKLRKAAPAERTRRAKAMLETVRLPDKYTRRIHQLSGGERQRVALARSLVLEPDILLLDEPLGALDERLRLDMQVELLQLQRQLGTTFVFITHSQEEAITMSDRIILMRDGRVIQQAAPKEMFERPSSSFAGAFMGVENIFRGTVSAAEPDHVELVSGQHRLRGSWTGAERPAIGSAAAAMVRAERVQLGISVPQNRAINSVPVRIRSHVYKGKYVDLLAESELGEVVVRTWDAADAMAVQEVHWAAEHTTIAPDLH